MTPYRTLILTAYRASGLSLRALEQKSGVAKSTLARYLATPPQADLTAQHLEKLATALGLELRKVK